MIAMNKKFLIPLALFAALVVFLAVGLTRDPRERERKSARTTDSVRTSTVSRTLADAAPCVPWTARNAFISATAILLGSNDTTAPLRRRM